MKTRMSVAVALLVALVVASGVVSAGPAALLHNYELNGDFLDELAGPALEPVNPGGYFEDIANYCAGYSIPAYTATGYHFDHPGGVSQGLRLYEGLTDPGEWSIELRFTSYDFQTRIGKVLDFKHLADDIGIIGWPAQAGGAPVFYLGDSATNFVDGSTNSSLEIYDGNAWVAHFMFTRDPSVPGWGGFKAYNWLWDTGDVMFGASAGPSTVFSTFKNAMHFFVDDEWDGAADQNISGFLDFIRIYQGVLTAEQVCQLHEGVSPYDVAPPVTGGTIPEPFALGLLGLGALVAIRRRRV